MVYIENTGLRDCSGFLQIRSHFIIGALLDTPPKQNGHCLLYKLQSLMHLRLIENFLCIYIPGLLVIPRVNNREESIELPYRALKMIV